MLTTIRNTIFLYIFFIVLFYFYKPQYFQIKETTNGIPNYIILLLAIIVFSTISYLIIYFVTVRLKK
jgi:hypothetical protein